MSTTTTYIKKEKAQVPVLRFNEFNDLWKQHKIGEFVKDRKEVATSNAPLYSLTIEGGVVPKSKRYERSFLVKDDESAYKLVHPHDFAFNPMNLRFGALAKYKGTENVAVSKYYDIFYSNDLCDADYLEYFLTSYNMIQFYNKMSTGTLEEKKRVHYLDFIHFKKLFPSLPEQKKIASFLTAVDEKIQQLTKKKALLEDYKKGVMQQLFSGKLRFKDANGNDYPDWEFPNANVLFKSVSDKNHNSDLPILAITQDQGAIPRELIDYKMVVSEKSVASYKVVQVGDFIISLRSFQGGIEYSNYNGICSPAYNILRSNSESVNSGFYKRYLKTEKYIRQLQSKLEGIRDGKMISFKYFSEIKLPFPCEEEQQKIATYLSSIDTKIEVVNNQITQTQQFKKGLLQQLFV